MTVTEPVAEVDDGGARPQLAPASWLALAVVAALVLGGLTFAVRDVDGVVARGELLAEEGGRVSAFDRANAAADELRGSEVVTDPPPGVDEVLVSVRAGQAIIDVEVVGDVEGTASAHLDLVIEAALAASRDEEVRILETQIAELELTLESLDPDDPTARRARGDIEVRRGQLAVLTGLIQQVGTTSVAGRDAAPLRDGIVVALTVLLAVGVLVPWATARDERP
ncbi:MAG: hypothetical protein AAFZ07_12935 [Actinomycetota bacterium]